MSPNTPAKDGAEEENETARPPRPAPGAGRGNLGMPAERANDFIGTLRRMVSELRTERVRVIAGIGFGVLGIALTVLGPALLGAATNVVVDGMSAPEGVDFGALAQMLGWVLVVYAISSLFMWIQGVVITVATQNIVAGLRRRVQQKLSRVPLAYFDSHRRGEVLSRVTNDIDNIAQTMQQTLSALITAVLTIIGVLTMMFIISPLLALVALVTVPLSAIIVTQIAKRSQPQFIEQWKRTGTLNAHVEEMYTGHSLVKVFGHEASASKTFNEENEALYSASFKAQFITGTIQPVMGLIANLTYVLVAVIGGFRVISGNLTIGEVQAFIQYSRQFSQPVTQIASMLNLLQSGMASAERVFEILGAEEQSPEPPRHPQTAAVGRQGRGRVAFEDVSFAYDPDTPLIEGLSLVAEPGQTVAIVGPTGAGKTTLVNLIMRFYEVDAGRITLDGADIAGMARADLRSRIGMVLQDTWLFGGTIAENIAYGVDGPVDEARLVEAAEATHVDPFVRTLAQGYDTPIDDEGVDGTAVSSGEKQLLTIARAFLSDPDILILDEATSSVDTRTEVLVQQAMSALRAGRTSFVIAHRLSTIRDADVILVMEAGQIVEQGSHDDLITASGAYARLYESQFAAAATEWE